MTPKPRLSRGLRDLPSEYMLARHSMVKKIQQVYELYGFSPLETPAVEYLDVLSGSAGEEAQNSIFRVSNPEEEELGLRFDLTVPLSRFISQYKQDITFPFRRYQLAQVWRADKPGPGRYREFTQFDIDSVGAESEVADTEIIAAMCDTLDALKVGPYRLRFSSRKILSLLLNYAAVPSNASNDVFRVLDKMEKVGFDKVKKELTSGYTDSSGDTIRGLGLSEIQVAKIEKFLAIGSSDRDESLEKLANLFREVDGAKEELAVLGRISSHLRSLGYDDDRVTLDVSTARGLAYYTGPVFEAVLLNAPHFGSIFGGGRYDDLVTRFTGQRIPATGASIGVDRLLAALIDLEQIPKKLTTSEVFVSVMDPSLTQEYLAITYELRRSGIPAEMHVGHPKRLGKQLQRADRLRIPYVVIMGSDEASRGVVTLKEMDVGRTKAADVPEHQEWKSARFGQQEVNRSDLVQTLQRLLQREGCR